MFIDCGKGPPDFTCGHVVAPFAPRTAALERSLLNSQHRERKSNPALLPVGGWAGAAVGDTCVIVNDRNDHDSSKHS